MSGTTGDAADVRFRMLGTVEVTKDGTPVPVGGGTRLALLAELLLAANRFVAVDTLIEAVWGEAPPAHPRASVHSAMSRLRRLLGEGLIETELGGYRLQVSDEQVDLFRFERDVASAAALPDARAIAVLEGALALWRGTPLSNVETTPSIEAAVSRYVESYLAAYEQLAELSLRAGSHEALVERLSALVEQHPYRERLVGLLMHALYRSGRQADALAAYDRLRALLDTELGVEPGAPLRDLYIAILRADDSLDVPRPSRPGPLLPRQLPAGLDRLHGRERELAALDEWFAAGGESDSPMLAALVGPGGIGKTALAVHWARGLRDRFPDGQLYLDLRGYGNDEPLTATAALERMLRSLGVDPTRMPVDEDERAAMFRSVLGERRMLIVLDNAHGSYQVRPLLPASGCLVIVTSRSQLRGLALGESAYRITVSPLDPAATTALLADATSTRFDPHDVARLTELCAGTPLALRIVAERLGRDDEELPKALRELQDVATRLDVLATGDDLADMRRVLSWSYAALPVEPARAFRLLAAVPGSDLSLSAAAALLGRSVIATRRILDHLVDTHLLEFRHGRYGLHDLLRAYGLEQANRWRESRQEQEAGIERLIAWYTHAATTAVMRQWYSTTARRPLRVEPLDDELAPMRFSSSEEAAEWLDVERPTLRALVTGAVTLGLDPQACLLALAVRRFLFFRAAWADLLVVSVAALEAAQRLGDVAGEADLLRDVGNVRNRFGDNDAALGCFNRSLELSRKAGDQTNVVMCLRNLSIVSNKLGRAEEALSFGEQALSENASTGNRTSDAMILNDLANAALLLRRGERAIEYCEAALRILAELPSPARDVHSYVLDTLGEARLTLGRHREAIAAFEEAIATTADLGDFRFEASVRRNLGRALRGLGEIEGADASLRLALALFERLHDPIAAAVVAELEDLPRP